MKDLPLVSSSSFVGIERRWPVADEYFLVSAVKDRNAGIVSGKGARHYRPQDQPGLPREIAKLAEASDSKILRFCREWGLLGLWELKGQEAYLPPRYYDLADWPKGPEPLEFIRLHADRLALGLSLVQGLRANDAKPVTEAMPRLLPWLLPAREDKEPWEIAWEVLRKYIDGHTCGLTVRFDALEQGTPGFIIDYTAMIEVAYWHVGWLASKRVPLGWCEECGAMFRKSDRRQRFCPKGPYIRESPCANRYRYRKFKHSKKEDSHE